MDDSECGAPCEAVEGCPCICTRSPHQAGLHSSPLQHSWGEEHIANRGTGQRGSMRQAANATPRAEAVGPPDVQRAFTGQQQRDIILPRVTEMTEVDYKAAFFRQVHVLAQTGEEFTSEDVTAVVGLPSNPNSVGALMNSAGTAGIIVRVGDVKAQRANQHATRIGRWRGTSAPL